MTVARFWRETLRRYNLGASKCPECQAVFFPPRSVCPNCSVHRKSLTKMEACQLSGRGEVYSYTTVHEAADGFEMQVPYVLALVKMAEGPMLTGQIVDVDPKDIREGLPVRATFRRLRADGDDGVIHYGYKFALENGAAAKK